ncbi:MAG: hypothetical protein ACFB4J_04325 [Elainellaceae cyanobacterium]
MVQDYSTALVIYEDRPAYEVGLKLLISSLATYAPDIAVHVFAPNATADFRTWLSDRPVTLHDEVPGSSSGFNVKPDVLLWALAQGYHQALWLDDDIILTRPLPPPLLTQPPEVLVAAEISRTFRTKACVTPWGFSLGRTFPVNLSACCFRVTQRHRHFLEHWRTLLSSPEYRHWQTQPRDQRPTHMIGSDAVLHALLGSETYRSIPIYSLKKGRDIAQCLLPSWYAPARRMMSLVWGVPPLIHAIGLKPWLPHTSGHRVYQALSPYSCAARHFKAELGPDTAWLDIPRGWAAWHGLMQGHPALTTLPFAFTRPSVKQVLKRSLSSLTGSPLTSATSNSAQAPVSKPNASDGTMASDPAASKAGK